MGGSLNYEKQYLRLQKQRTLTEEEKYQKYTDKFPNCSGLYPDCPKQATAEEKRCISCPKFEKYLEDKEKEEEKKERLAERLLSKQRNDDKL